MLEHMDPKKAAMAKLVKELLNGVDKKPLREFIIQDWPHNHDMSYADLGEVVLEEVLCSCEGIEAGWTTLEPLHHPDCDAWDPKASAE